MTMQKHGVREYHWLECHFCNLPGPVWRVVDTSSYPHEEMLVCETHKFTAFS